MPFMHVEADCYSGYKADERPVRFRLDGHEYQVEETLDQWHGQSDVFFKVRADDGNLNASVLRYSPAVCHPAFKLARSPEYRRCVRSLRTAIPTAFFCPTSISSFFLFQ
jgi:hypothetical protein